MDTSKFLVTTVTALSVVGSITFAYAQTTTAPHTMPGQTTETMPTHPAQPDATNSGTSGTPGATDTTGNSGTTSGTTAAPSVDRGMTNADERAPIADRN